MTWIKDVSAPTKPPCAGAGSPAKTRAVPDPVCGTGNSQALEAPVVELQVFSKDKCPYYEGDRALAASPNRGRQLGTRHPALGSQQTALCPRPGPGVGAPGTVRKLKSALGPLQSRPSPSSAILTVLQVPQKQPPRVSMALPAPWLLPAHRQDGQSPGRHPLPGVRAEQVALAERREHGTSRDSVGF